MEKSSERMAFFVYIANICELMILKQNLNNFITIQLYIYVIKNKSTYRKEKGLNYEKE